MNCIGQHITPTEATGYVRYVRKVDGAERIRGPYCDGHQGDYCDAARWRERQGEIGELGAIPLDYAERLAEAERAGRVRRIRGEMERHPGTDAEIAEDVVSALLSLPYRAPYIGVPSVVLDRLQRWAAEQDEASATMRAEIDPEDLF